MAESDIEKWETKVGRVASGSRITLLAILIRGWPRGDPAEA